MGASANNTKKKKNSSASGVNSIDDRSCTRPRAPRYIREDEALKKVIKEILDGHFDPDIMDTRTASRFVSEWRNSRSS